MLQVQRSQLNTDEDAISAGCRPVGFALKPFWIETTGGTPQAGGILNASGESANSARASATPSAAPTVTITVDPTKTKPISPYIYGLNFYTGITGAPP